VTQTETLLLQEILRGAQLAIENAEKLYQEAGLLASVDTQNRPLMDS
jgi:hypothetical protein